MHGHGKSDGCIVPAKLPNNAARAVAEKVGGRSPAKGHTDRPTRTGHSAGQRVPNGLDRVREAARRDKQARFTALLHHVDLARLAAAYSGINPKAAPGVDQVTWDAYGQNLHVNLEDLSAACTAVPTGRALPAGGLYRSRTGGSVRSGVPVREVDTAFFGAGDDRYRFEPGGNNTIQTPNAYRNYVGCTLNGFGGLTCERNGVYGVPLTLRFPFCQRLAK